MKDLNSPLKDWLLPSLNIEYVRKSAPSMLAGGSFQDIPQDTVGARVSYGFPFIGPDGRYDRSGQSYYLYVGEKFNIKELLDTHMNLDELLHSHPIHVQADRDLLETYLRDNVKEVVYLFTEGKPWPGIIKPVREGDKVYATREEMDRSIHEIYNTYMATNFSVSFENIDSMKLD